MSTVEPGWIWDEVSGLDYDHAAHVFGVPVGWLKKRVPEGGFPHSRFGKHVIFSPEDIAEGRRRHRVQVSGMPGTAVVSDTERARLRAAIARNQAA